MPVMIDSSKWSVIEAGLMRAGQGDRQLDQHEGGRGDVPRARAEGARATAPPSSSWPSTSRARPTPWTRKVSICERAYRLLTEQVGFPPEDIIFDPNIFAVATGIEEHNDYARRLHRGHRADQRALPARAHQRRRQQRVASRFRGNEPVREAIHSVFLYHAIRAGMDMGIVNAGQLVIYDDIEPELRERVEDVVLDRRDGRRPNDCSRSPSGSSGEAGMRKAEDLAWRNWPVAERLEHALVQGIDDYVIADTEEARAAVRAAARR